ncbi:M56 family metallopeptidase [Clostridium coskatii]|uniref:Regulatory protein BlaR1 n=1 Tax=Clostridium coskatii TaxID=1705578 RepID=A0A166TPN1_9CLOT|nr:M56 family metallopeptidase [Clostridium coskatii]OAA93943.1 Regulatory protein BlaR1 [Clostridium coskatii]OBR95272.1 regulatory protein BlaR1 [Clostridium coskatii]
MSTLMKAIFTASLNGSILVILILLIKNLLKERLKTEFHYILWFLLIIKLIIPYGPESNLSIFNIYNSVSEKNSTVSSKYYLKTSNTSKNKLKDSNVPVNLSKNKNIESSNKRINYKSILFFIWLIGMVFFIANTLYEIRKVELIKKNAISNKSSNFNNILNNCLNIMNINKSVSLIYPYKSIGPCLCGLIKPTIFIPQNIIKNISEDEFKHIIIHELCHLKRKDLLINWIIIILNTVYWFNPIIRYGFYKMKQDCETSCDAYALRYLGIDRNINYGNTIIKILQLENTTPSLITSAPMAVNNSEIKRRITMISKHKKNSLKNIICGILVIAAITTVGLTSGISKAKPNSDNYNSKPYYESIMDYLINSAKGHSFLYNMNSSENNNFTSNNSIGFNATDEFQFEELDFNGYQKYWSSNFENNIFAADFDFFNGIESYKITSHKTSYSIKINTDIKSGNVSIKIYNDKKVLFEKINPANKTITISKEDAKNIKLDCIGIKAKGTITLELN